MNSVASSLFMVHHFAIFADYYIISASENGCCRYVYEYMLCI